MSILKRLRSLPLGVACATCGIATLLLIQGCAKEEVSTADASAQSNNNSASSPRLGPPTGGGNVAANNQPPAGNNNYGGQNAQGNPYPQGNVNGQGNPNPAGQGNPTGNFGGNNPAPNNYGDQPSGAGAGAGAPSIDPAGPGGRPDQGQPTVGSDDPQGQAPTTTNSGNSGKVGLNVGDFAPEIIGPDLDGVEFKLSDYRGQVIMLDFWGDW